MVLGEVRKKYDNAESAGFCLNSDGTRDSRNVENLSVMIRFVSNSMPEGHLIGCLTCINLVQSTSRLKYGHTFLMLATVLTTFLDSVMMDLL